MKTYEKLWMDFKWLMCQGWMTGNYPQNMPNCSILVVQGLLLVKWGCHVFGKIWDLAVWNRPQDSTVFVQHPSALYHFVSASYKQPLLSSGLFLIIPLYRLLCIFLIPLSLGCFIGCLGFEAFKMTLHCKIIRVFEQIFKKNGTSCSVCFLLNWLASTV